MGYIVKHGEVTEAHKVRIAPSQKMKTLKPTEKQVAIKKRILERKKLRTA